MLEHRGGSRQSLRVPASSANTKTQRIGMSVNFYGRVRLTQKHGKGLLEAVGL